MSHTDRKALRLAVRTRDVGRLEDVLHALDQWREAGEEMDVEVEEARRLLHRLKHVHNVTTSLQEVKTSGSLRTMMEQLPPHPIQLTVLKAVFLALGVPEVKMQDWSSLELLIGSSEDDHEAFVDAVLQVNRGTLPPTDVTKARDLLSTGHLNEHRVRSVCPSLTPFYLWLLTLMEDPPGHEEHETSGD